MGIFRVDPLLREGYAIPALRTGWSTFGAAAKHLAISSSVLANCAGRSAGDPQQSCP